MLCSVTCSTLGYLRSLEGHLHRILKRTNDALLKFVREAENSMLRKKEY